MNIENKHNRIEMKMHNQTTRKAVNHAKESLKPKITETRIVAARVESPETKT